MDLPIYQELAERFAKAGYELYVVGGTTRDYLLGRPLHDIDLASDAPPRALAELLPDAHHQFLRYGIVSWKQGPYHIDVASFRQEKDYQDYRHPSSIAFVKDIKQDAARRDFTINALYYSREGKIHDFYHGMDDLHQQIIRTIGDPIKRFQEDPLRMIRALRFQAELDFAMSDETKEALIKCWPLLTKVSLAKRQEEIRKFSSLVSWQKQLDRHGLPSTIEEE